MPELEIILEAQVNTAINGLNRTQKELAETAVAANKLDSSLRKGVKGTNEAGLALSNLGRVAQDAPFGFIGIQNNLNPLLESFQRLRATTTSNGAALKLLGSAMLGPAGLGFALSAISSLLLVFGDRLFKSSSQIDEAKKAIDGFNEGAAKEILKLKELTQVAADNGQAMNVRLGAVQKLKAEYPNYLKGLSDEQILSGQIGDAYDRINEALLAKASLQAAEEKVIPLLKQQVDLLLESQKARQVISGLSGISDAELKKSEKTLKFLVQRRQAAQDLVKLSERDAVLQREINNLISGLSDILRKAAPLDLVFKPPKKEKVQKDVKTLAEILHDGLHLHFKTLEPLEVPITANFKNIDQAIDPARAILKGKVEQLFKSLGKNTEIDFFNNIDLQKILDDFESKFRPIADIIKSSISDMFVSIGESVGNLENPFNSIFQLLGGSLQALGKQLIVTSTLISKISAALNAALSGLPFAGIAVGVGLIAVGSLLKRIPKFAEGGIATGPTLGVFGEAGKEAVIPLDRLNEFLRPQSSVQPIILNPIVRGQNLVLATDRTRRSNTRNF